MDQLKILDHPDLGKFILRIAVGLILFLHGLGRIESGAAGTIGMVEAAGLPGWLAYGAHIGEFVAPIFLIFGKFTRLAGLAIAFTMLMTILVAHRDIAFQRNEYGGWLIELNVILLLGGVAVAVLGAGRLSLSRGVGKFD